MCELSPVSFHGDTIFCIDYHGEPFTPMKPIVENMGMDWAGQFSKLRSNQARWGIENISIPTESGVQEMVSMPVRKLPAYLASINPRKVRAELRQKIELYQNESDNALWDYWTKGRAERQPVSNCNALSPTDAPLTPDQQCTLQAIVKAKIEALPEDERKQRGLYPKVWSRFNNHFRLAQYRQLPQCRLSEAIAYLTQMDLSPAKQLPRGDNTLPGLPVPSDAQKQLKTLHSAREVCRWDFIPAGFYAGDRKAAERFRLSEDLYRLQDNLWAALYNICSAAARLRG